MSNYYRVKKLRELKRRRSTRDNESIFPKKDDAQKSPSKNVKTDLINNIMIIEEELDEDEFLFVSDGKFALLEKLIQPKIGINEKIAQWILRNLDTLRLNVVMELLTILRDTQILRDTYSYLERLKHCQVRSIIVVCK